MSKLDQLRALRERQYSEPPRAAATPIAVYRCFDASGALLYVGQSFSPMERIGSEHARRFAGQLATVSITWHETKDEALSVERLAIRDQCPLHNQSPGNAPSGLPQFKAGDGSFDRVAYQREYMRKRRAERAKK